MGYWRAGFDVVGVDIKPQPHYPFEFVQRDALEAVQLACRFDAIHASPPCQTYSTTAALHGSKHPDLYAPTRDLLQATGLPYVLENVIGAPYDSGIVLCGGMFGLKVRRHRNFETSFLIWGEPFHYCPFEPIDVTGTGGPAERRDQGRGGIHRKPRNLEEAREAMGIGWMSRRELSQAIPPAYTEWIGKRLSQQISVAAAATEERDQ